MESCKFHPTAPSNFHCSSCQAAYCSSCIDHSVADEPRCFICSNVVTFQVTADNVEPFWRRLEKAFKYPLNVNAMMVIVGLSIATIVISALPFPGLIKLLLLVVIAGASTNYSFLCLKTTSEGDMNAPSLADAFSGSLTILIKLIVMMAVVFAALFASALVLGPVLTMIAATVIAIGAPAILMHFGYTDNALASLNPLNFVRLMTTIGMPYAVLILFLLIMIGSMTVLNQIIASELPVLSTVLQSFVGSYYSVVMFHLMGYLLFQYQSKLGISVSTDGVVATGSSEPANVAMAHFNLRLKMGDYQRADELMKKALHVSPNDTRLWLRYFDFLYRAEQTTSLTKFADEYFQHLISKALTAQMNTDYKKVLQVVPAYQPEHPDVRYYIAGACHNAGDSMAAVRLINGMHKQFPTFDNLIPAYKLMKDALSALPKMESQVEKCARLIQALEKQAPTKSEQAKPAEKAVFNIEEEPSANPAKPIETAVDASLEERKLSPIEFKP